MGPACGLHIPMGTLQSALLEVARLIQRIADAVHNDLSHFNATDLRVIGCTRRFEQGSFFCSWNTYAYDEIETLQIEEAFGISLEHGSFEISSGFKGTNANYMLATIVAYLAERCHGLIDFGSKLDEAAELAGQMAHIEYENVNYQTSYTTVLDAVALRSWMEHPNFWMVK